MITVLLIIASQGYQSQEYGSTRQELENAGIKVVVASDIKGIAHASQANSEFSTANVDLQIAEINVQDYDGIFLIGGPGALTCLDNQSVYQVMQSMAARKKSFGAICLSPRILAHAGLLQEKNATGWNGDNALPDIFKKYKVNYTAKPVVVDGNIITADGPQSAQAFGQAIIKVLQQ